MITGILFENLWSLAIAWVMVQFILIAMWSRRRDRLSARIVWGGFAALPLLVILSIMVVTPREQIIRLCRDLAGYVDDGNVAAIEENLASDVDAGGLRRDEFTIRLERTLTYYRVDDPVLRGFEVTLPGADLGVAEFQASANIRSPELIHDWFTSRWRLTCRRSGGEWEVTKIESLPTPPLNIHDLGQWLGR